MSLLNRKAVKDAILSEAQLAGRTQFTRVGKPMIDRIEARIRLVIRDEVHRHPSVGITLK